jgi:uncharacterized protein YjeT (DUF2065 family)
MLIFFQMFVVHQLLHGVTLLFLIFYLFHVQRFMSSVFRMVIGVDEFFFVYFANLNFFIMFDKVSIIVHFRSKEWSLKLLFLSLVMIFEGILPYFNEMLWRYAFKGLLLCFFSEVNLTGTDVSLNDYILISFKNRIRELQLTAIAHLLREILFHLIKILSYELLINEILSIIIY